MADVKKSEMEEEECVPVKRKLDSSEEEDVSKKLKPEMPAEEVLVAVDGEDEAEAVKSDAGIKVEEDDEADDDEFDGEQEEEEEGKPNGVSEIDRKGKGIMREEDEEEDEDEDIDSSDDDDDDFSDEKIESDLEDDPLAEVDLDNILPCRTRRRGTAPAGICLSKNEASSQNSSASKDNTDI